MCRNSILLKVHHGYHQDVRLNNLADKLLAGSCEPQFKYIVQQQQYQCGPLDLKL